MMKMRFYPYLTGLWACCLFLSTDLFSQKYSNEFLAIGVGARGQGMGDAIIARINDVTAGYWNPAGLAGLQGSEGLQVGAMHAEWFAGVGKYDYLGITFPSSNRNQRMGISLIRFGIDDIPNTLSLFDDDGSINYDNVTPFSAADYAMVGSYARKLRSKEGRQFYIGGNIKVIRRVIGTFANSWGFGMDLGIQYHTGNWKLAAVGRDITSTFNAWHVAFTDSEKAVLLATGNELPDINSLEVTRPRLLVGAAYTFHFNSFSLSPEINLLATTDGKRNTLVSADPVSLDPRIGAELNYMNFLFLRAGLSQLQRETDFQGNRFFISKPAIGVGFKIFNFRVDYAFTDLGDSQNRYSHIVSLQMDLKPRGESGAGVLSVPRQALTSRAGEGWIDLPRNSRTGYSPSGSLP